MVLLKLMEQRIKQYFILVGAVYFWHSLIKAAIGTCPIPPMIASAHSLLGMLSIFALIAPLLDYYCSADRMKGNL